MTTSVGLTTDNHKSIKSDQSYVDLHFIYLKYLQFIHIGKKNFELKVRASDCWLIPSDQIFSYIWNHGENKLHFDETIVMSAVC